MNVPVKFNVLKSFKIIASTEALKMQEADPNCYKSKLHRLLISAGHEELPDDDVLTSKHVGAA